jgi:hypothetical protein
MVNSDVQKHVFFTSFLLTVLIFSVGVMLNYSLDFVRLDEINGIVNNHELSTQSYVLEQDYFAVFGGNECQMLKNRIGEMNAELQKVRSNMDHLGGKSFFKKGDFEDIRRKFFLLQIKYYTIIDKFNKNCNEPFIPVLFFYQVDDSDSITQGYILEDLAKSEKANIAVLNFDIDFKDEPLINILKFRYNVSSAPMTIINDADIFTGLTYTGVINASVIHQIRRLQTDRYSDGYDMKFTLDANGINVNEFADSYVKLLDGTNLSNFGRADAMLLLGRITDNKTMICAALPFYDNAALEDPNNFEQNAIAHETIASIGCGRNWRAFYRLAAEEWTKAGSSIRAEFDLKLADNTIRSRDLLFNISDPEKDFEGFRIVAPLNSTSFITGVSSLRVGASDVLVSQVDRVTRDFLSFQLNDPMYYGINGSNNDRLLSVFSESLKYNESELRPDIGWHEGARIKELKETGLSHYVASGTLIAKKNDSWYAMNEYGVFMFEVPKDKVFYPTTRFFTESLAMVVDTHGVNEIVEQAVRHNATFVVACCDSFSKIQAALYLDKKGISTICFTDKYLPFVLGSEGHILGSPPITHNENGYITIGYRPIEFRFNETFVVMDATSDMPIMSYYKTPKYYFRKLTSQFALNVTYVTVTGLNQMENIVSKAKELNSDAIAARVFNSDDYNQLKEWLTEDKRHRAILFHSMAYPYGYLLFNEFPEQTTFDDIRPIFG